MIAADTSPPSDPGSSPPTDPVPPWDVRTPGTYLLLIRLDAPTRLDVGRLGSVSLPAGWYVYVGSALSGLGARLRRHVRPIKQHHWHVDILRAAGTLTAIAIRPGPDRLECATATTVAELPGGSRPVPRFGSSDCRCRSHLVYFPAAPNLDLGPGWLVTPFSEQHATDSGQHEVTPTAAAPAPHAQPGTALAQPGTALQE